MIKKWLFVNALTVVLIIGWSLFQGFSSYYILSAKIVSQVAFLLFLINVNMYIVLLLIRKGKNRNHKITLAKISKKMMKFHVPIATSATLLILIHAMMMLKVNFQQLTSYKIASGIIAIVVLIILLLSGLLRRLKASGFRRKFHYKMAFIFFGFIILHIFL